MVVSSLDALRRLLQDPRDLHRGGPDCIRIHGLEVATRIGVGEEERSQPQKLVLDVVLETDFAERPTRSAAPRITRLWRTG